MKRGKEYIEQFNSKYELHGYYQNYNSNGKLYWKGNWNNDEKIGIEVLSLVYIGVLYKSNFSKQLIYNV